MRNVVFCKFFLYKKRVAPNGTTHILSDIIRDIPKHPHVRPWLRRLPQRDK